MKEYVLMSFSLLLLITPGCATEYTCGAYPGSKCKNVDQVYEETSGGVKDYRTSLYKDEKGYKRGSGEKLVISTTPVALKYVEHGDPILTKPVILRVLITSWEDSEKDLHTGGYIYIRLKDSEWRL